MARRVQWTPIAVDDLMAAHRYIGNDSRQYADAVIRNILDIAESLGEYPLRGRVVPEFNDPVVRQITIQNYRLIHRVRRDAVQIVAIIHGSRDLAALWQREGRE